MLSNLSAKEIAFDTPAGSKRPELQLTRRRFLQGSGILMGTLAIGTPLAVLAPSLAWALELTTLDTATGEALLKLGRTIFPHPNLQDAVYAVLVKDLDSMASADPKIAAQLKEGVSGLNKAIGGLFATAEQSAQIAVVKSIEGSPFFATVHGKCVHSIYDNEMTWAVFGYPGECWSKGGYIARGFQDLKWLPDPPPGASPAPYFG